MMLRKLCAALLILACMAGGYAAGQRLRPVGGSEAAETGAAETGAAETGAAEPGASLAPSDAVATAPDEELPARPVNPSYFEFPDQFFVPVMRGDRLDGIMVLTLSVEMESSDSEAVYAREFRLRDAMLRALLIHANTGGFDGNFTTEPRMRRLHRSLLGTAREASEGRVTDVLIGDLVRQEPA
ncbi:hypothetical protein SAMN05421538_106226 [Paracoccus isoporae]|uniref:Flagellar protein FliL n=1 Tax=Paracoccus isoporae TaxID=591205 RepID=A0A1G7CW24_9RHOB|nr:hypothetical protein [Paracoccus isoporae]SDE43451.1 hypothetical protein SAMN05421538_106226 [Paracoccus isoporae]